MKHSFFRVMAAALLIVFGIILILENVGAAPFNLGEAWLYAYPVLFILFGLKILIDRLRKANSCCWFFGLFLLIFGSLLLLDRFQVITFTFGDVLKLWPLLIIYLGISFISHSTGRKNDYDPDDWIGDEWQKYGSFFSFGDYEYNQPNWKVEPMILKNLAGDFYIDLSKAYIPEKEIPIMINALAGDVHILVPENVDFRVFASVKAGELKIVEQTSEGINRSLRYETEHYDIATRKLDFILKLKAGSIRVVIV